MPLGMVAGLLLAVVGCYGWLDSRFDGLNQNSNRRFGEIATALRGVEDRLRDLEIAQRHHWDSLDMKDWVLEFKRLNPDLSIPPLAPGMMRRREPSLSRLGTGRRKHAKKTRAETRATLTGELRFPRVTPASRAILGIGSSQSIRQLCTRGFRIDIFFSAVLFAALRFHSPFCH